MGGGDRYVTVLIAVIAAATFAACDKSDPPPDRPAQVTSPERELDAPGGGRVATREGRPLRLCGAGTARLMSVPGARAIDAWRAARGDVGRSGRWPVVIGSDEDLRSVRENLGLNCKDSNPDRELREAESLAPEALLARRRKSLGIRDKELRARTPLPSYSHDKDQFSAHIDLTTNKPYRRVWIALLPTKEGAAAPALLMFGGWNDNPRPAVHVALHRDWHERYGSEIVAVTNEIIETHVARPPKEDAGAIQPAREQFIYAPDIVWQGTSDLATLAASLRAAPTWYFWWD